MELSSLLIEKHLADTRSFNNPYYIFLYPVALSKEAAEYFNRGYPI